GQQVALHAFARHVRAHGFLPAGDLVDFVDEHDAVLFGVLDGAQFHFFFIDHLGRFLIDQELQRLLDLEFAGTRASPAQILEHALQLLGHFLHARRSHDFYTDRHGANFDFDLAIVQLAFAQHFAKALPRVVVFRTGVARKARLGARQQDIEDPVFGAVGRAGAHLRHFLFTGHFDGDVHKIADDRVNFAANISHFSEFRGLDLDEGRLGEPRQPPGDLGFANPGGADHEYVFRRDFRAQGFGDLLPPPALAQRTRHRAL